VPHLRFLDGARDNLVEIAGYVAAAGGDGAAVRLIGEIIDKGRVVLARRERPIMLEPYDKGIRAFTLRYASEVRDAAVYFEGISGGDH
jgi:plasmid stabilization system protein ParE